MFLVKKAVRLATEGTPVGVACEGCPPLADRVKRYEAAGGRYYVCPICFTAKKLSPESLIGGAELQGTVPLWEWIGDDDATTTTTFSDDLARQRYALARPRTSRMTEDILRANRCLAAAARHAVGVWRMPPLSSWPRPGPPRGPGRVAVWTLAEQQVGESLAGQVVPT